MTLTTSIFITIIVVFFLINLIRLSQKDILSIRNSLKWYVLATLLLIFVWNPSLLSYLSQLTGVYSDTNLVFFVGFCISLWIIFDLSKIVTLQGQKMKILTQRLALLENEVITSKKTENQKN